MTNEEAIKELSERYEIEKKEYMDNIPEYVEALRMGIESLSEKQFLLDQIENLKQESVYIELQSVYNTARNLEDVCRKLQEENEQLKSGLAQSLDRIKQRIINRRWKVTSDASNLEAIYMSWANTMNDWCVEIVEEAEKSLEVQK